VKYRITQKLNNFLGVIWRIASTVEYKPAKVVCVIESVLRISFILLLVHFQASLLRHKALGQIYLYCTHEDLYVSCDWSRNGAIITRFEHNSLREAETFFLFIY
jgi:hypothetical protein